VEGYKNYGNFSIPQRLARSRSPARLSRWEWLDHEFDRTDSRRLNAGGGDLSRRALEAFAAAEYKHDRLTKPDLLQRILGMETSFQLDEFLKAHDVWIEYTREDAARERRGLERLGF